jgi:uncharacterized caspase-like protein
MARHVPVIGFSLGLLCSSIWADPTLADRRVALVIGNSAYQHAPVLAKPVNDARAMAAMFERAGFAVVTAQYDASNLQFKSAIRQFEDAASGADIGVVYYAGHAINVHEMNYLIPVDAKLESDRDARDEAITLDRLVESVDSPKRLRLVIIDACRDNPFLQAMRRMRALRLDTRLGKVDPTTINTLITFAAKGCAPADDGNAEHSPYASALLQHLFVPGLDVRLALGRVREEVLRNTGNRQEPFVHGSLSGNVSVVATSQLQPPAPALAEGAKKDYDLIAKIGTKAAWEAFLLQHPRGSYADKAREQLAKLVAPHTRSRLGLVIGNASYIDDKQSLSTPISDARALAEELRRIGFDLILGEDLSKEKMRSVIEDFQAKVTSGATTLFFFSGYGIQAEKQTYVIPVDARIRSESEVKSDGFSIESILNTINAAGGTVKVVIIDAARANPFEQHFRGSPAGLAPLAAPGDTLAIYSAVPNKIIDEMVTAENTRVRWRRSGASLTRCHRVPAHATTNCSAKKNALRDGSSLFVSELLNEMRSPGLTAEEVFDSARIKVSRASERTQVPRVWSFLNDEFFFTAPASSATPELSDAAAPTLATASARPAGAPSKAGKQSTARVFGIAAQPSGPSRAPEPMPTAAINHPPATKPVAPPAGPAPPHGLPWWWPQWH